MCVRKRGGKREREEERERERKREREGKERGREVERLKCRNWFAIGSSRYIFHLAS